MPPFFKRIMVPLEELLHSLEQLKSKGIFKSTELEEKVVRSCKKINSLQKDYASARKAQYKEPLTKVRKNFVNYGPAYAYAFFQEQGDLNGIALARKELLRINPDDAYLLFRDFNDEQGLAFAREKLLENPTHAYWAFHDCRDKDALPLARKTLAETNPLQAYRDFRDARDEEGLELLRKS